MVFRLDSNGKDLGVLANDRNRAAMWRAVEWIDRELPSAPDLIVWVDYLAGRQPRLYFGDWT